MILRPLFLICLALASPLAAQTDATARYMNAAKERPGELRAFLREMPKGGDIHTHLSGAIYAESFIQWGAEKGGCIRLSTMQAIAPPCDSAQGTVPIANAFQDQDFYDAIVDAWSMRNWSRAVQNGHDQFFRSFGKFGYTNAGRGGDMVAEIARRAASNRVSYLEIMDTPGDGAIALGFRVGWDSSLVRMRDTLRAAGLAEVVNAARRNYADDLTRQREILKCGTRAAEPACGVEIRFLYQVLRGLPPQAVYAQILTAFETASADSLVVGFNLVMPEDGHVSMRDFSLHMRIIDFLHGQYPNVKISLHAGELTGGLVPTEGLRFHIRESIHKGHASRIGHGTAIMYEDSARETLALMAKRAIAVEICLSSSYGILNVDGGDHSLATYQAHNVPTLLCTDDEGVSRSEMTEEFMRAVLDQGVGYRTLKNMVRNSIKYSFVQEPVKARLLAKLERDFSDFEKKWSVRIVPR